VGENMGQKQSPDKILPDLKQDTESEKFLAEPKVRTKISNTKNLYPTLKEISRGPVFGFQQLGWVITNYL
jgi:hypothetical protein